MKQTNKSAYVAAGDVAAAAAASNTTTTTALGAAGFVPISLQRTNGVLSVKSNQTEKKRKKNAVNENIKKYRRKGELLMKNVGVNIVMEVK